MKDALQFPLKAKAQATYFAQEKARIVQAGVDGAAGLAYAIEKARAANNVSFVAWQAKTLLRIQNETSETEKLYGKLINKLREDSKEVIKNAKAPVLAAKAKYDEMMRQKMKESHIPQSYAKLLLHGKVVYPKQIDQAVRLEMVKEALEVVKDQQPRA